MDVDWSAEVVDQIESHWQHRLRPRLNGLTDDEYFWQPVADCWTISRRGQSSAPISWRLAHLIVVFAGTNGKRFGGPAASWSTYSYAGTAGEALRQLDHEYKIWVDGVRSLGTAGLARPQGDPPAFAHEPLAKKMLYVNVEVIHHGAEICLLRDLYLWNGSGN